LDTADFSGDAGVAARWTATALDAAGADWLRGLAPLALRPGVELFHGSPRDPVWDYVLTEQVALISILETAAPLVLVGHSHVAMALGWDGDALTGGLAPDGTEVETAGRRWLVNPGARGLGPDRRRGRRVGLPASSLSDREDPGGDPRARIAGRARPAAHARHLTTRAGG
jgi:hypothetical protein